MDDVEVFLKVFIIFHLTCGVATCREKDRIYVQLNKNTNVRKLHNVSAESRDYLNGFRSDDDLPKLAKRPFKIAAFNVRKFGTERMKKPYAVQIISETVLRNDITLIMEVQDSKNNAIWELLNIINSNEHGISFNISISNRVGRSKNKEQYAFIYRIDRVTVTDTYQYEDDVDGFERPPFSIRVTALQADVEDFALIATHTRPDDAVNELNNLTLVHKQVENRWKIEDIMILGDFNADCDFVKSRDWSSVILSTDKRFYWLLDNCADTTTGNTDCAYDRFVVSGTNLQDAVVPGLTNIFKFDEVYKLNETEAYDVSDHYPIEMAFVGKKNTNVTKNLNVEWSFTTVESGQTNRAAVRRIYRMEHFDASSRAYFTITPLKVNSRFYEVRAAIRHIVDPVKALRDFQMAFPGVISKNALGVVKSLTASRGLTSYHTYVYGLDQWEYDSYEVEIVCTLRVPFKCQIKVSVSVS